MSSFFRSPSIVFGHPITCTPQLLALKYSARTAAFVLESSPPMITIALMLCFLQTSAAFWNCSFVSSFVLPLPMMSNPPVFLNSLMYSSVNVRYLSSVRPLGPPRKPISWFSGLAFFSASYRPETTLCPPGAWPPERITPTTFFFTSALFSPFWNEISFCPKVFGNRALILSWSAALVVACPSTAMISFMAERRIIGSFGS